MKYASVILGGLFVVSSIFVFSSVGNYSQPARFLGFVVTSEYDHATQVRDAFKVGLSAGLLLCGICVLVFLWDNSRRGTDSQT
jgi:uncharacterized membrane protein YciS (DUF1049 family)